MNQPIRALIKVMESTAEPVSVPTGLGYIFAKKDGHLYYKNDAGEVFRLSCCDEEGNNGNGGNNGGGEYEYGYEYGGPNPPDPLPEEPPTDDAILAWMPAWPGDISWETEELQGAVSLDPRSFSLSPTQIITWDGLPSVRSTAGPGLSQGFYYPENQDLSVSAHFRSSTVGSLYEKLLNLGNGIYVDIRQNELDQFNAKLRVPSHEEESVNFSGGWHHLAVSFDKSAGSYGAVSVYLDGSLLLAETLSSSRSYYGILSLLFGRSLWWDNIRIYDRLLTSGEIFLLSRHRLAVLETEPQIWHEPAPPEPEECDDYAAVKIIPSMDFANQNTGFVAEMIQGTLLSTTATWQTVEGGNALRFYSLTPNLTFQDHAVFSLDGPRSYAFWIATPYESHWDFRSDDFYINAFRDYGYALVSITTGQQWSENYAVKQYEISDDEAMQHICITFDGVSTWNCYVNGNPAVLFHDEARGSISKTSSSDFAIKMSENKHGYLDDLRAYERVLTSQEILTLADNRGACLTYEI